MSFLKKDERGASAVLLTLVLPLMVAFAGLAVDAGQLYMAQSKVKTAVDAGALAGSLELPFDPDLTKNLVRTAVKTMVAKNDAKVQVPDSKITAGTAVRSVCVEGSLDVPFYLMTVLGFTSSTVTAKSCAGFNNLEVVFVIDNTGSMAGTPITKVKEAATNMVNLIIPDGAAPSTKVGLVPFRGKVRVPSGVDGQEAGCRNADGTLNTVHYKYDSYQKKYVTTTNDDTCVKGMPAVQGLTTTKTSILSSISSMTASSSYSSGTIIAEGVKWATGVLTPEAPYTQGGDPKKYRKVMILLTDGDNEDGACGGQYAQSVNPNPYWNNCWHGMANRSTWDGFGVHDCHCNDNGCLDQQLKKAATTAKDASVEIFTIRYGDSDANDRQIMKTVASSKPGTEDHYFDAPSANDFDEIFKLIGRQLGHRLLN